MKFTATILNTLVVVGLLTAGTNAEGIRGVTSKNQRELQAINGVACVTVTGSDGTRRTVTPCNTQPPAGNQLNVGSEDSKDDKDSEDGYDGSFNLPPGFAGSSGGGGSSGSGSGGSGGGSPPQQLVQPDIVDTALSTPSLYTLTTVLFLEGLVPTLRSPGPFTVFAPINSAFPSTSQELVQLKRNPKLGSILTYHVVPGIIRSTDLSNGAMATTVQGSNVTAFVDGTSVKINDANVVLADVEASNGIVHLIDTILMPPN